MTIKIFEKYHFFRHKKGNVLVANNTLVELNLNNNRICHVGAQNLAKGLSKNESLSCLRIKGNSIKEEGFLAILQVILKLNKELFYLFFSM